MAASTLFTPYQLGDLTLPHRIVMAPMTRSRAGEGAVPTALNAHYYAQRASAGLIVSEGTQVSMQGVGYAGTPGIHNGAQVAGWRTVTDAVHQAGGRIFAQLWHVGRVSHVSLQPDGADPIAPSALAAPGEVPTHSGMMATSPPRALATEEVGEVVLQFAAAARNARDAGFDGVEIHGANGYLIEQFLYSGSNQREDRYGGSIDNRARFLLDIVDACSDIWPAARIGVRLSPQNRFHGMEEPDRLGVASYVARELDRRRIGYLHLAEFVMGNPMLPPDMLAERRLAPELRQIFNGTLMLNGGFDAASAERALNDGVADLISFGIPFLANPDLPARLRAGIALNAPDPASFYGGDAKGYVDYPFAADATAAA